MPHPTPSSLRTRLRRLARGALVAAAATIGTVTIGAGLASASDPGPPVVADFPTIAATATQAMDSLTRFEATGDLRALHEYQQQRRGAAELTAQHLGYPAEEMVRAWSTTTAAHQQAVLGALTQLGVPYRYSSSEPGVGFDCSGLTSYAWRTAGHDLFRNSSAQISATERRDRTQAKAGDLVQYPGHVMLYLGVGDAIVHSVQTGRTVELDHINGRRANSVRFGDPIG